MKLASLPGREGLRSVYGGVVPAVVGSVSSSAIYFGTYEFAKRYVALPLALSIYTRRTPSYVRNVMLFR